MNTRTLKVGFAAMLAAMTVGMCGPVRADGDLGAAGETLASSWNVPKQDGKLTLVLAGQSDPVTVAVSDATVVAGICQDCSLPLEFKPGEAGTKCSVCGCGTSNAACIVGKPVKEGTWQAMIKGLPLGVGLRSTFNVADKPESGLKRLQVDFRSVLLAVTGADSLTTDQLLALVKPLGGSRAELIDGNKHLSIQLKSDWSAIKEGALEKALVKINAKVVVFDDQKAAQ